MACLIGVAACRPRDGWACGAIPEPCAAATGLAGEVTRRCAKDLTGLRLGTGVRDFPPDETALIGAAVGFSQVGLLPICEIPYAKYLDCGYDQFEEAAIAHWLSNGQSPNGDHGSTPCLRGAS